MEKGGQTFLHILSIFNKDYLVTNLTLINENILNTLKNEKDNANFTYFDYLILKEIDNKILKEIDYIIC